MTQFQARSYFLVNWPLCSLPFSGQQNRSPTGGNFLLDKICCFQNKRASLIIESLSKPVKMPSSNIDLIVGNIFQFILHIAKDCCRFEDVISKILLGYIFVSKACIPVVVVISTVHLAGLQLGMYHLVFCYVLWQLLPVRRYLLVVSQRPNIINKNIREMLECLQIVSAMLPRQGVLLCFWLG